MDYEIHFEKSFDESILKYSLAERKIIFNKINFLKNNPDHTSLHTEKLFKGTKQGKKKEVRASRITSGVRLIWQIRGGIIYINEVGGHDIYRKYKRR